MARDTVARDGGVEVLAVVRRGIYLEAGGGVACLCEAGMHGPLVLELAGGHELPVVAAGSRGTIIHGLLRLTGGIEIDCGEASIWRPAEVSTSPCGLRRGLQRLGEAIDRCPPADGLAPFIAKEAPGERMGLDLAPARQPLAVLRQALPDAIRRHEWPREAIAAASSLLGLGPGLTPSGDDLVSGLLIVLRATAHGVLSDRLWDGLAPSLGRRTTTIGAACVRAAARGEGNDAFHALMNDVLAGGTADLACLLERACAVGHTSGWDTIAGLFIGLEAIATAATAPPEEPIAS